MDSLAGTSILLVEDDEDSRELLVFGLERRGASVGAVGTAEAALESLGVRRPDVLICNLALPGVDGTQLLSLIRANPELRGIVAIALSGRAAPLDHERSIAAGFHKHLSKPAKLADIINALEVVGVRPAAEAPEPRPTAELYALLAQLNAATPCRYTSLMRFDGERIQSVWTYDRDRPRIDPSPSDMAIGASYCSLLQARPTSALVIEDALTDERTAAHPAREGVRAYVGVPLFAADGAMFGTVCSYDPSPRTVDPDLRTQHEATARSLEIWLRSRVEHDV